MKAGPLDCWFGRRWIFGEVIGEDVAVMVVEVIGEIVHTNTGGRGFSRSLR